MNLLQIDSENNKIRINDEAKLQRNSKVFLMSINLLNALINISNIQKEEFNFVHAVWIILGSISILILLLERNKTVAATLDIADIKSYSYKENIWNSNGNIIIHLNNSKKRYISITTKDQLEQNDNQLLDLNLPKNVKIRKSNS